MVPKMYHFHNLPPILPILHKEVVLQLREHGDVIKTQTIIIYLCDMHNNIHVTQSLSPQTFLTNSVPGFIPL